MLTSWWQRAVAQALQLSGLVCYSSIWGRLVNGKYCKASAACLLYLVCPLQSYTRGLQKELYKFYIIFAHLQPALISVVAFYS